MYIAKGTTRIALVFDNFVIKLSRLLHFLRLAMDQLYKFRIRGSFRKMFIPIRDNLSEFVFYRRTCHVFCAKTYFSFFGLFNIQERVVHLEGNDPKDQYNFPRYEEYESVLKGVFWGREKYVESHTFLNPINFGFSKKRGVFVCVDYADPEVQKNILEFGDRLQEAFKDFDKQ